MTTEQMACVRELADDLDRVVLEVSARDGDATARQYARAGAIRAMLAELDALKAREAKLREALTQIAHGGPLEGQRVASPMKMYQAQAVARAALAALEDTPPVCDCNGGEQGDGLCALPHEPTCASLKREDTRG